MIDRVRIWVERRGGLHRFMNWNGSILTDSGGYQVFSLSKRNEITDEGVYFNSHSDGRRYFIGPKESMQIQCQLGSDIAMVFDECPPYPCEKQYACQAVRRTLDWATICKRAASRARTVSLWYCARGRICGCASGMCASISGP